MLRKGTVRCMSVLVMAGARGIALLLVALFCLQLSRSYFAIEACWHYSKNGNWFQHCKDTPDGLVAHRIQPGVICASVCPEAPEALWVVLPSQVELTVDTPISPPFHPPRSL